MSIQQWELDARDGLIDRLRTSGEGEWKCIGQEVTTANGSDYDFELECDHPGPLPIALEVTRLQAGDVDVSRLSRELKAISLLKSELQRRGIHGWQGQVFPPSVGSLRTWAKRQAKEVEEALRANPGRGAIETSGLQLKRVDGIDTNVLHTHRHGMLIFGPEWRWVHGRLLARLRKKRRQLDVTGHTRVLLLMVDGSPVSADAVVEACSLTGDEKFQNVDRIFLIDYSNYVELVWDRIVLDAFARHEMPPSGAPQKLALRMLWHRLYAVFDWARQHADLPLSPAQKAVYDFALEISWEFGLGWPPEDTGYIFEYLAERVFTHSGWQAPKELFLYFREQLRTHAAHNLADAVGHSTQE